MIMTDKPAPLVPAEVDLSDFKYMELDVRRLRDSRFGAEVCGDAFRAGVMLWCAAWHQVPCGSVPDDDIELANLAGYGRFVKEWKKIRAQALQGFVLCSDGRLYHEVVAEKAMAAWNSKLAHFYERAKERLRKANKAAGRDAMAGCLTFEQWNEQRLSAGIPMEKAEASTGIPEKQAPEIGGIPPENALRGNGEGTERERNGELLLPSGDSGSAPSAAPPTPPPAFDGSNAEALNGKAVVTLAERWELPEAWGVDAEALGWKPAEVMREAERFRQYWVSGKGAGTRRSVKGWRQAWSNWLARASEQKR